MGLRIGQNTLRKKQVGTLRLFRVTNYVSVKQNHVFLFKYNYMIRPVKTTKKTTITIHLKYKTKYNAIVFTCNCI
jgi:hypothetical protein